MKIITHKGQHFETEELSKEALLKLGIDVYSSLIIVKNDVAYTMPAKLTSGEYLSYKMKIDEIPVIKLSWINKIFFPSKVRKEYNRLINNETIKELKAERKQLEEEYIFSPIYK